MGSLFHHIIAKTGDHDGEWLPLNIHLLDTAKVTEYLITDFLSDSIWDNKDISSDLLRRTALFLAYVHDIGKATSLFQSRITSHLPLCHTRLTTDGVPVPPPLSLYLRI